MQPLRVVSNPTPNITIGPSVQQPSGGLRVVGPAYQAPAPQSFNPVSWLNTNFVQPVAQSVQNMVHIGGAGALMPLDLYAHLTGNQAMDQNLTNSIRANMGQVSWNQSGQPLQMNRQTYGNILNDSFNTASLLPFGFGLRAAAAPAEHFLPGLLKSVGTNMAMSVPATAGQLMAQDGPIDPVQAAKLAAINAGTFGLFGAGLHIAGAGVGAGAKVAAKGLQNAAVKVGDQGGFLAGPKANDFVQNKAIEAPDKIPRMEVSDNGAALDLPVGKTTKPQPLGQVYDHPTLYAKYPDFANIKVETKRLPNNTNGHYNTGTNTITLNSKAVDNGALHHNLLHEIQHVIQTKEGFAPGGSPEHQYSLAIAKAGQELTAARVKLQKVAPDGTIHLSGNGPKSPSQLANEAYMKAYDKYNTLAARSGHDDYMNQYQRLAGEAEARSVAHRQGLTQQEINTGQYQLRPDGPYPDSWAGRPIHGPYSAFYTGVDPKRLLVNKPIKGQVSDAKVPQADLAHMTMGQRMAWSDKAIAEARDKYGYEAEGDAKVQAVLEQVREAVKGEQLQKTGPFREGQPKQYNENGTEKVARERFNLPALKKISSGGSDRDVYDLGDGHVLKVAKTARGLAQNSAEHDYYAQDAGLIPKTVEAGKNYVVSEKMNPPDAATRKMVKGLGQFTPDDWRNHSGALQSYLEKHDLSDIMNYDVMYEDFAAIRNWGTTADGKPIHVDGGSLNNGILDDPRYKLNPQRQADLYAGPASTARIAAYIRKTNLDDPEFRDAYNASRAAKKQYADADKATMYSIGPSEALNNPKITPKSKAALARLDATEAETDRLLKQQGVKVGGSKLTKPVEIKDQPAAKGPVKVTAPEPVTLAPGEQPRGFTTSLKTKPNDFSQPTQAAVDSNYTPQTHDAWQTFADQFSGKTKTDLNKAFVQATDLMKPGNALPQGQEGQFVTAIGELANRLDKTGENGRTAATVLLNRLAEYGTHYGQALNAFALALHRTPAGLLNQAKAIFTKFGVTVTPEMEATLRGHIETILAGDEGLKYTEGQRLFKYVESQLPPSSWGDRTFSMWRSMLLSGPLTLSKVIVSHALVAPFEALAKLPALMTDQLLKLHTHQSQMGGNIGEQLGAAVRAIKPGAQAVALHLKSGIDAPNTGGFGSSDLAQLANGQSRGVRYNTKAAQFASEIFARTHGSVFKLPYRMTYDATLMDLAGAAAHNAKVAPEARAAFMKNLLDHPTSDMKLQAQAEAEHATMQQKTVMGKWGSALQSNKVGRWLAPFARIPSAIGTTGLLDYTPAGYVKAALQLKAALKGGMSQRQFDLTVGRATAGTGVAVAGGMLMAAGRMTLSAPADQKERSLWEMEGKQPNSILIGGTVTKNPDGTYHYSGGHWQSLNAMGPLGITLGLGGGFERGWQTSDNQANTAVRFGDAVAQAGFSGAKVLADQPYLKGISGLGAAVNDPTRSMQTFVDNTIGTAVPTGIATIAKATDTLQRDYPKNPIDAVKNRLPWLREQVAPNINTLGQTDLRQGGVLQNLVDPFYSAAPLNSDNPVVTELQRLYNAQGSSDSPAMGEPSSNVTISGGTKLKLTPQQHSDYLQGRGAIASPQLAALIASPGYQAATDAQKTSAINKVFADAGAATQATQLGDTTKLNATSQSYVDGTPVDPATYLSTSRISTNLPSQYKSLLTQYAALPADQQAAYMNDPQKAYQYAVAQYQNNKANGKYSATQDYTAQQGLAKQNITKDYSNDVTQMYGMSKANLTAFLQQHPDAANLLPQVYQLDQQLTAAKLASPKFFNKYGQLTGLSTKTSSGGGSVKVKKLAYKLPVFKVPAPPSLKVAKAKTTGVKVGTFKKVSLGKTKLPKITLA